MLSRQNWVEVRGAAAGGAGRPRAPKARSPRAGVWGPSPEYFQKLSAGNAFSKHFRRFLVTLKEWVIPRKRLRIFPAGMKLAASNFARRFIGVMDRVSESPILGNFAPPEAQNRTNRRAAASI